MSSGALTPKPTQRTSRKEKVMHFLRSKKIIRNLDLYLLILPVLVFYIIFCYRPMYGLQLAFKDYVAIDGIFGSPWVGLKHFERFFGSPYFLRLISNTLSISVLQLLFGFPIPVILALLINEMKNSRRKKLVQNVTYVPHFLSTVVIVGMLKNFVHPEYGIINMMIAKLGGSRMNFMEEASWFHTLYVASGVWQNMGWDSIIFIASLSGVDPQLHESAKIDGAGRMQRIWHINMPAILPTIVIVLILNVGGLMNIGFEKAFLMQNDLNLSKSDIISTYSYRLGIQGAQYSYATAIGFFNSIINFMLLVTVNTISRRISSTSLW
ncbi:ABC transporter permease subunit [Eubacteriales bacterium mix99]|jgi:putative aldouronate transport system permease protein